MCHAVLPSYSAEQVRDSLAQTLNTEIVQTIQKLDSMGQAKQELVFQRGPHTVHQVLN